MLLIQYNNFGEAIRPQRKLSVINRFTVSIKSFVLQETIGQWLPRMFDPRQEILLFSLIWDYGKICSILPLNDKSKIGDWEVHISRQNRRILGSKEIKLIRREAIFGALNLLLFLHDGTKEAEPYTKIIQWINESHFYNLIHQIQRNSMQLEQIDINQKCQHFTTTISQVLSEEEGFILPIFGACFTDIKTQEIQIDNAFFQLLINWQHCT